MGTESCSSRTAIPRFRKDWQSPRSISRVVLSSRAAKLFGTHRINCTAPTKHPGLSVCCCSEGKPAPFLSSSCSPLGPPAARSQHLLPSLPTAKHGIPPGRAGPSQRCLEDRRARLGCRRERRCCPGAEGASGVPRTRSQGGQR